MKEPEYQTLVKYKRNALVEQEHSGIIIHMAANEILNRVGKDNEYKFYQRSCMKPLQIAKHIDLGLFDKFGLSLDEIAVCAASHSGDLIHQQTVRSVLNKIGLTESALLCAAQVPLSKKEQDRLLLNQLEELPIHNNCSGKHAAMLALCVDKGWQIENYMDDNHPLTECVISKVLELSEVKDNDYIKSKDGCGLPTIATTLRQLGKGFLNLFLSPKYSVIKEAFLSFPYLIGGDGRHDSEIINASQNLVAKVGAGGLIVVVNIEKEEALVVKIADANMKARALVVIEALRQLKWLSDEQIQSTPLAKLFDKSIKTLEGESLGQIELDFSII